MRNKQIDFFSSFDFYKFLFFFIPGLKSKATLEIKKITSAHLNVLRVKRMQKLRKDDYGKLIEKDWIREIKYFHLNTITLDANCFYGSKLSTDEIYHLINLEIDLFESTQPLTEQDVANLSPVAFEAYCAWVLNENGWQANTTKSSGDQGIDVIATKGKFKAVFQCKKYTSPVGNKAVQEVIAGKTFASADLAFVVSNTQYTRSAVELAHKAGVHLIHYSELLDLQAYIKNL